MKKGLLFIIVLMLSACDAGGPGRIVITQDHDEQVDNTTPPPTQTVDGDPLKADGTVQTEVDRQTPLRTIAKLIGINGISVKYPQSPGAPYGEIGKIDPATHRCRVGQGLGIALNAWSYICIVEVVFKTFANAAGVRVIVPEDAFFLFRGFARVQQANHAVGVHPRETWLLGSAMNLVVPRGHTLSPPGIRAGNVAAGQPSLICETDSQLPWVDAKISADRFNFSNGAAYKVYGGCKQKSGPRIVEVVDRFPGLLRPQLLVNPYLFVAIFRMELKNTIPGSPDTDATCHHPVRVAGNDVCAFFGDQNALRFVQDPAPPDPTPTNWRSLPLKTVAVCNSDLGYAPVMLSYNSKYRMIACVPRRFMLAGN